MCLAHYVRNGVEGKGVAMCSPECPVERCKCVFPFTFNGVTYNKCIVTKVNEAKLLTELGLWTAYDFSWAKFQTPWCASKVDDQGRLVRGNNTNLSRHMTACSQDCPFDDGKGKKNSTYQIKLKRFIGYKSVTA